MKALTHFIKLIILPLILTINTPGWSHTSENSLALFREMNQSYNKNCLSKAFDWLPEQDISIKTCLGLMAKDLGPEKWNQAVKLAAEEMRNNKNQAFKSAMSQLTPEYSISEAETKINATMQNANVGLFVLTGTAMMGVFMVIFNELVVEPGHEMQCISANTHGGDIPLTPEIQSGCNAKVEQQTQKWAARNLKTLGIEKENKSYTTYFVRTLNPKISDSKPISVVCSCETRWVTQLNTSEPQGSQQVVLYLNLDFANGTSEKIDLGYAPDTLTGPNQDACTTELTENPNCI